MLKSNIKILVPKISVSRTCLKFVLFSHRNCEKIKIIALHYTSFGYCPSSMTLQRPSLHLQNTIQIDGVPVSMRAIQSPKQKMNASHEVSIFNCIQVEIYFFVLFQKIFSIVIVIIWRYKIFWTIVNWLGEGWLNYR